LEKITYPKFSVFVTYPKFSVFVRYDGNFSTKDQAKLASAISVWEKVFNSSKFRAQVLYFAYSDENTSRIVNNFNYWPRDPASSREKVLDLLLKANEKTNNEGDDYQADVWLNLDLKQVRGVLGYTYPNSKFQWIYSWFFRSAKIEDIAMNLAHEYCHKLGFDHAFENVANRRYSVPYAIGYLVKDLGKDYL